MKKWTRSFLEIKYIYVSLKSKVIREITSLFLWTNGNHFEICASCVYYSAYEWMRSSKAWISKVDTKRYDRHGKKAALKNCLALSKQESSIHQRKKQSQTNILPKFYFLSLLYSTPAKNQSEVVTTCQLFWSSQPSNFQ